MNVATRFFAMIAVLGGSAASYGGVDVIVNAENGVTSLTADSVKSLWTAASKAVGDEKAAICDQSPDSAVRAEFYSITTRKSVKEMQALWSKLVFTGRGTEPKVAGDDAGVIECVKANKGGIGYVTSGKTGAGVKTVLKLP